MFSVTTVLVCCLEVNDFYLISLSLKVISKLPSSKRFQRKEFALIHFQISRTYDLENSPKNNALIGFKIMFLLNNYIMSSRFLLRIDIESE